MELSRKDIKKGLKIPQKISKDLAYIIGVLAGDGNIYVRDDKKDYRIKCVGNPKDEKEFYNFVLKPIFKRVFNIDINVKIQDSGTTYGFYIYSKALVKYLSEVFELPVGKKYGKLKIPYLIKKNKLVIPFIRGLADTDFCLTYKKNTPCVIGSSNCKAFMQDISKELKKLGFQFYEVYDYKLKDNRFERGCSLINRIEICGKKKFSQWMEIIGFSSPKHLRKIKK